MLKYFPRDRKCQFFFKNFRMLHDVDLFSPKKLYTYFYYKRKQILLPNPLDISQKSENTVFHEFHARDALIQKQVLRAMKCSLCK